MNTSTNGIQVDPNDLIDSIVDAINYAEIANDPQGLIKARRLLNNDLRQAIDGYIDAELTRRRSHNNRPASWPGSPVS
jgi:hypothetical protein